MDSACANDTTANANVMALLFVQNTRPVCQHLRQMTYAVNSNFSDTFWIVSGNPPQ